MDRLHLTLLGDPKIVWRGTPLPLPRPKPLALLVYLHLHGQSSRDELAEVLWPEHDKPLKNVRQEIFVLRQMAGADEWLQEEGKQIVLLAESDISQAHRLIASGQFVEALNYLGEGELLAELSTSSAPFQNWLIEERRVIKQSFKSTLGKAALQLLKGGDTDRARDCLQRATNFAPEPADEPLYRLLMQLEHDRGHTDRALGAFEECRQMIEREVGEVPSDETLALLRKIEGAEGVASQRGWLVSAQDSESGEPLVGRETELQQVGELLSQKRRALIHGLGGIGKSRLAQQHAQQYAAAGKRVAWLEVNADSSEVVLGTLREILEAPHQTPLDATVRELDLLVLDNAAHSFAVQQILQALPTSLEVLVTSRLRLPHLPRLELGRLARQASLDLLGQHLAPGSLDPFQQDSLCAMLGDHPFAIRLVAHTLNQGRTAELLQALSAAPHDSIRVLLEQSLMTVDAAAYEAFLGLGGLFAPQTTPELLSAVLQRPLSRTEEALYLLTERGLLSTEKRMGSDVVNFRMHDLTWHAAREHRAHLPHLTARAIVTYVESSTDQTELLAADLPQILGAAQTVGTEDLPRLMKGWLGGQYIAARGFPTAYLKLLENAVKEAEQQADWETASLLNGKQADIVQALLGNQLDALALLVRAAQQAALAGNIDRQATQLSLAGVLAAFNRLPESASYLESALKLADQSSSVLVRACVREQQAISQAVQRNFEGARTILLEAKQLLDTQLQDNGKPEKAFWPAYMSLVNHLGQAEQSLGRLENALAYKEEVWQLAQQRGDKLFMAWSAIDRGELLGLLGRKEEALAVLDEAIKISQETNSSALEVSAKQLFLNLSSSL